MLGIGGRGAFVSFMIMRPSFSVLVIGSNLAFGMG